MECFRCFDMKVVDSIVLDSIKNLLIDCYEYMDQTDTDGYHTLESLRERINNHIILLEAMPDE